MGFAVRTRKLVFRAFNRCPGLGPVSQEPQRRECLASSGRSQNRGGLSLEGCHA